MATPATVFPWDGVARGVRAWTQDQPLGSAFHNSPVWVYQQIALMVGAHAMSAGLNRGDDGNMSVRTAQHLTTDWLDGALKTSAIEQVEFLSKLALRHLPLATQTHSEARKIMIRDADSNWVMRSKTGWYHTAVGMDIRSLECFSETNVFALNIDMPDTRYLPKRTSLTYAIRHDTGAFACL